MELLNVYRHQYIWSLLGLQKKVNEASKIFATAKEHEISFFFVKKEGF